MWWGWMIGRYAKGGATEPSSSTWSTTALPTSSPTARPTRWLPGCASILGSRWSHATEVADRWHLLANTGEMVQRWLVGVCGRLRRLPPIPGDAPPVPGQRTHAFPRSRTDLRLVSLDRVDVWESKKLTARKYGGIPPLLKP
ncbi:protein of unknown function [Azospirillum baldaniorum]|uniref:Uncharacterized protein n=1 Tax=Azospirillum baldaniorum TaxID=1064539 RepID=A0A9P1NMY9_9PROT|nr:protein of unknown function [Azospirillum baldaniorum]